MATTPSPVSDPNDRLAQTFPELSDDMIARIAVFATEEKLAAGTMVFREGDRSAEFFVVLEGAIEIFTTDSEGLPNIVVIHHERQFTGDVDLYSGRQILVNGRARVDSRVLRVTRTDFRRLVGAEPDVSELLTRAFILRRVALIRRSSFGVVVLGASHSADTLRIVRFLSQNAYPHRFVDADTDPDAPALMAALAVTPEALPVFFHPNHPLLSRPTNAQLADSLGLMETLDESHVFDVIIVGAGPAGLASAVYAASEGLDVLVVEGNAPGGQAGTSSKIENYLGFPTGISGQALASRAQVQAQKFGARLAISRHVVGLECDDHPYRLVLDDGRRVSTRSIVVATGARYRKLELDGGARFEGAGVHFAATAMEEQLCAGEEVAIAGGGNSAGQAAMYLARRAGHVHVIVRGPGLAASMSDYLVQRLAASPRITLHDHTRITTLEGDDSLRRITWTKTTTGETETRDIRNLFVMIGAEPNTSWLEGCLALDAHGFVIAGGTSSPYATSRPGVFAVGDVRAGSVKRVASAVGEGSVVVQAIHTYLSSLSSDASHG